MFCLLSDWHIGENVNQEEVLVNKYNEKVAFARLKRLISETKRLIKLHKPKKVVIACLGDMISGNIHVDIENIPIYEQITKTFYFLGYYIANIKSITEDIEFIGVYGNHARTTKEKVNKNNFNNYDLLIYDLLSYSFQNIQFHLTKSHFLITEIEDFTVFATHGHYLNIVNGIPFYSLYRKQNFNKTLSCKLLNKEPDIYLLAHTHESQSLNLAGDKVFINGTLMGVNEYAFNKGLICNPSQKVIVIDSEHTIGSYDITLDINHEENIPHNLDSIHQVIKNLKIE